VEVGGFGSLVGPAFFGPDRANIHAYARITGFLTICADLGNMGMNRADR